MPEPKLEREEAPDNGPKEGSWIKGILNSFFDWIGEKKKQREARSKEWEAELEYLRRKVERIANPQSSINQINQEFGLRYGLSCPPNELPRLFVFKGNKGMFFSRQKDIDAAAGGKIIESDIIGVDSISDVFDGNGLSEELAHFYRSRLQPENDVQEFSTDEFFGYLGSRLFEQAVERGSQLAEIAGTVRSPLPARNVLDASREIKNKIAGYRKMTSEIEEVFGEAAAEQFEQIIERVNEGLAESGEIPLKNIQEIEDRLIKQRRDILAHQRGYKWASLVKMDEINDWKKLFSLPNEEVRRKFFTDKQDSSGL